jgi:hypothetical protein
VDGDQVAFDDSKFKPGDEVASYVHQPAQGRPRRRERGAALGATACTPPMVSRKLTTGSKFDVQFEPT